MLRTIFRSVFGSKEQPVVLLGSVVKDNITGLTGVATVRATFLFGCVRILVAGTELHEGKVPDGSWLDEQRVEVIDASKYARTAPVATDQIQLGNMVRDRISGFEGMATARIVSLYNADDIVVTPNKVIDNQPGGEVSFSAGRLDIIADTKASISENNSATSGGPQNDYRRAAVPAR